MARTESFNKEELLKKGVEFIKEKGIENLNARDLAKYIGCSTQPIFRNYENMQEYKNELKKCMRDDYSNFINKYVDKDNYLFTISYSYVLYAKTEPNIFKALFITELAGSRTIEEVLNTDRNKETINSMIYKYNLQLKQAEDLYRDVRFFTHGLSCQIACNSIKVTEVRFTNKLKNHPVCLTTKGDVSLDMEKVINAMPTDQKVKAEEVLEINENHPIKDKLLDLYQNNKEELEKYTKILYSEARLIEGLQIDNPTEISNLICDIISK